jgi:hypothetical protein
MGGCFLRKGKGKGTRSYRICAPGGLAMAPLADGDREETERAGASESDWKLVDMRGLFFQKKEAGTSSPW